ncbi:MAG: hypothetical protein JXB25_02290 [Deltaproteobacteria bacterium]|nr:hypothetical protein [Deltaproteobacteria bacterium]
MTDTGLIKCRSELLVPVIEDITELILLIRNAFNRQKISYLNDANQIQNRVSQEISNGKNNLKSFSGKELEKKKAVQIESIFSHLELVSEATSELRDPIRKQISEGILFSDKAISQTNFLFDHQAGLFRSLADIFLTDNQILENYVTSKVVEMDKLCIDFATDHEARLIEGLCQPKAAPIFLAILDSIRIISHHEREILQLLKN